MTELKSLARLRQKARDVAGQSPRLGGELIGVAHAIEREHGKQLREAIDKAHADGERNGLGQARSASEDYRHGREDALTEVERTHVALPLDMDGEPIRMGDVVERADGDALGAVTDIVYYQNERRVGVKGSLEWYGARDVRHVHHDTWERIIEDAYRLGLEDGEECSTARSDFSDFVARCEALAGDE